MLYETMAPTPALPALVATPRSSRTQWKALGDPRDALRDRAAALDAAPRPPRVHP
ncbi:hypothetical protein AURDEDRAFT_178339 [Auricularia subglabra TFB-10046 SS5]|uniref:Uncharacterized protein n=1 Tax=Auricularia subglabra (strain TFB-10046 / SS5) TaxID=717982 RepID=J0CQT0_AURST|nr:hypothetical protein AURDEDRAFT_178339 [Auricularia subglabra TFB-10046 SS5]